MSGDRTSVALAHLIAQAEAIVDRVRADGPGRAHLAAAAVDPAALEARLEGLLDGAWTTAAAPERARAKVRAAAEASEALIAEVVAWATVSRGRFDRVAGHPSTRPEIRHALAAARPHLRLGRYGFPKWRDRVRLVVAELEAVEACGLGEELGIVLAEGRGLRERLDALEGVRRRRGDRSTAASGAAQALRDAFRAALREILSDWEHAVEVSRGELAPLDLEILHSARAQARPRRRREAREPAVTEAAVEGAPVEGASVEGAPVEGVSEDAPAASMEDAAGEAPEDGAAA